MPLRGGRKSSTFELALADDELLTRALEFVKETALMETEDEEQMSIAPANSKKRPLALAEDEGGQTTTTPSKKRVRTPNSTVSFHPTYLNC